MTATRRQEDRPMTAKTHRWRKTGTGMHRAWVLGEYRVEPEFQLGATLMRTGRSSEIYVREWRAYRGRQTVGFPGKLRDVKARVERRIEQEQAAG